MKIYNTPRFEWTEEAIARLGTLWREGHSTAAIARMMGSTKNSIVGKAHRTGLPMRASPIRPGVTPKPPKSPRPVMAPLVTLKSMAASPILPPALAPEMPEPAPPAPPTPDPEPSPEPIIFLPRAASREGCQWPTGTPGTPGFRMCDAPVQHRRWPYCAACAKRAYAPRQYREGVAALA